MAAFFKALELGANGLETDLQRSADGVIFLLHDDTLDRTTNGTGKPGDRPWKELASLDAGAWFSPAYEGERLVTLAQFLHFFGGKPIHLALELKGEGLEADTVSLIRSYAPAASVTLTSFRAESLARVREQEPRMKTGWLVKAFTEDLVEQTAAMGVDQICPPAFAVTKDTVAYAKRRGLIVRAWKVEDERLMKRCLAAGVDGFTVNFPDRVPFSERNAL